MKLCSSLKPKHLLDKLTEDYILFAIDFLRPFVAFDKSNIYLLELFSKSISAKIKNGIQTNMVKALTRQARTKHFLKEQLRFLDPGVKDQLAR